MIDGKLQPVGVERKSGIVELRKNFSKADYSRFLRALKRLAKSYKHPILALEGTPSSLLRPTKDIPDPAAVVQHILWECRRLCIEVVLIGECHLPATRRNAGTFLLFFMLSCLDKPLAGSVE